MSVTIDNKIQTKILKAKQNINAGKIKVLTIDWKTRKIIKIAKAKIKLIIKVKIKIRIVIIVKYQKKTKRRIDRSSENIQPYIQITIDKA